MGTLQQILAIALSWLGCMGRVELHQFTVWDAFGCTGTTVVILSDCCVTLSLRLTTRGAWLSTEL